MKMRTSVIHETLSRPPEGNFPLASEEYRSVLYSYPDVETWERRLAGGAPGYSYASSLTPNAERLARSLAKLQGRDDALLFTSGKSAIATLLMAILKSGDELIIGYDCFKSSRQFAEQVLTRFGVHVRLVCLFDVDEVLAALSCPVPGGSGSSRKVLFLESPTNPMTRVLPLELLVSVARENKAKVVLDNTLAGVHNHGQIPVDYFVHSLTKFSSGSGSLMGGCVIGNAAEIRPVRDDSFSCGGYLDPAQIEEIHRGLVTFPLRYRQHCENAMAVATYLADHPRVRSVLYPGLASHPDHMIAVNQMCDFGAIVTFNFDAQAETVNRFLNHLRLFRLSFGYGVPQSIANPALLFYSRDLPNHVQQRMGITHETVRLACGLEDVEDLIEDLDQAFRVVSDMR